MNVQYCSKHSQESNVYQLLKNYQIQETSSSCQDLRVEFMSLGVFSTRSKLRTEKQLVEQLASKTQETNSFSFKLPFHDVSTSMSEILTFLHQIQSSYIKINHDLDLREKSQTAKNQGKKQSFSGKKVKFPSCVLCHCPCAQRVFPANFGGLIVHQIFSKWSCWKSKFVWFL